MGDDIKRDGQRSVYLDHMYNGGRHNDLIYPICLMAEHHDGWLVKILLLAAVLIGGLLASTAVGLDGGNVVKDPTGRLDPPSAWEYYGRRY